jgi:hypothetical protein
MTPAGREREKLTGHILDHQDQDYVHELLVEEIGLAEYGRVRHAMRSNGGGLPTVRDLCTHLDITSLSNMNTRIYEAERE